MLEPYGHGLNSKAVETLVAFQRSGASASEDDERWKAFHVPELTELTVEDIPFLPG